METIFALSSGRGKAGVAVIRVSGPQAKQSVIALSGRAPEVARQALFRTLRDPKSGETLDQALVLWFEGPASFTGEDCAEFQIHGGPNVVGSVLGALGHLEGCRHAEAGEFTRRAVENGKFDLTEAEGIGDLIEAETEAQRRQALQQMSGGLGVRCADWRKRLVKVLAYVEADIDFVDEDDVPEGLSLTVLPLIVSLSREIDVLLADGIRGERVREGIDVAIIGPPNAGKSSLLNWLARRDVAIVSEEAGTTRDIVEVRLDLGGMPVILADTAGLRETDNKVEQEGVRRALARAEAADLTILLIGGDQNPNDFLNFGHTGSSSGIFGVGQFDFSLLNKVDLLGPGKESLDSVPEGFCGISIKSGLGLEVFLADLERLVQERFEGREPALITRQRHRDELSSCQLHLDQAIEIIEGQGDEVFAAEEIRLAVRSLGRLSGRVDVEELLDVVFRDFCIGK
ncbi:MAG: tRNA uridine-5-carboxymethylaminomethyl(34) synthesis GTPase MnmE [Parvibaculaceae bacterium]|nr:tRNA uridine-5-carboxymethylaminomethyl(34) synthesis GTPase MnmE [Parvibaculaceae bacterium]